MDLFIDQQETAVDGTYLFTGLTVALSPAPPNPQICYVLTPDLDDPDLQGCIVPVTGSNISVPLTTDTPSVIDNSTSVIFFINAIPTLNRAGLVLMILVMMLVGVSYARRKRRATYTD